MKKIILWMIVITFISGCGSEGGLFGGGDGGGGTVWVTKSGRAYHRSDCTTIQGSEAHSMSLSEAQRGGYGQCQVCKP